MLRSSGLIGCVYKMMWMREVKVPASPYIAREAGLQVGLGESTSRVRLGVLYMVQDMHNFLSEYFSTEILALHANRRRAAKSSSPRGPPSTRSWYPPR
jgi:hypothetical protein